MLGQVAMVNRTGQPPPHHITICTMDSGNVIMRLEDSHVAVDGGSLPSPDPRGLTTLTDMHLGTCPLIQDRSAKFPLPTRDELDPEFHQKNLLLTATHPDLYKGLCIAKAKCPIYLIRLSAVWLV